MPKKNFIQDGTTGECGINESESLIDIVISYLFFQSCISSDVCLLLAEYVKTIVLLHLRSFNICVY
jgi:hypothetical protein